MIFLCLSFIKQKIEITEYWLIDRTKGRQEIDMQWSTVCAWYLIYFIFTVTIYTCTPIYKILHLRDLVDMFTCFSISRRISNKVAIEVQNVPNTFFDKILSLVLPLVSVWHYAFVLGVQSPKASIYMRSLVGNVIWNIMYFFFTTIQSFQFYCIYEVFRCLLSEEISFLEKAVSEWK